MKFHRRHLTRYFTVGGSARRSTERTAQIILPLSVLARTCPYAVSCFDSPPSLLVPSSLLAFSPIRIGVKRDCTRVELRAIIPLIPAYPTARPNARPSVWRAKPPLRHIVSLTLIFFFIFYVPQLSSFHYHRTFFTTIIS